MMKQMKYMLLALPALLASCEKEIDFEYHDVAEQQVIEGLLTQDGASIRLTKTVPTDEPFSDAAVTDAAVILTDSDTGETYRLAPDGSGTFTAGGLCGETGHTYMLTVTIGDKTYRASSRMLPRAEIVSAEFSWIKMPYDDVAVLKVEFQEDSDPLTQYWLRVYRNGEPYEWQVIESRNAIDGLVTGLMMTSRRDTEQEDEASVLKDGDEVGVEVLPISRRMGDYLNSLNNGDYNGHRMFDGPYCLGYFLAAPISKTRLIYHPAQIPYS